MRNDSSHLESAAADSVDLNLSAMKGVLTYETEQ